MPSLDRTPRLNSRVPGCSTLQGRSRSAFAPPVSTKMHIPARQPHGLCRNLQSAAEKWSASELMPRLQRPLDDFLCPDGRLRRGLRHDGHVAALSERQCSRGGLIRPRNQLRRAPRKWGSHQVSCSALGVAGVAVVVMLAGPTGLKEQRRRLLKLKQSRALTCRAGAKVGGASRVPQPSYCIGLGDRRLPDKGTGRPCGSDRTPKTGRGVRAWPMTSVRARVPEQGLSHETGFSIGSPTKDSDSCAGHQAEGRGDLGTQVGAPCGRHKCHEITLKKSGTYAGNRSTTKISKKSVRSG